MSKGKVIIKLPKLNIPYKYIEPVLLDVDKLVPHEEIVEGRLNDLIEQFLRDNAVDMPIVVAKIPGTDKFLIVDGHHRWAAVKKMGLHKIPCVVINYFSNEVKLMTWYPAIIGSIKQVLNELSRNGLTVKKCSYNISELDEKVISKYAFIILGLRECYAINGGIEEQKIVSKVLSELNVKGYFILVYYGELNEAIEDLEKGEIDYLFLRKRVTKEEVMEMARKNRVYAPKTTRHVLPFYPAKTYTPLEKLK
ncbi:MAG: DUF5603 domain-containing protein [Thermoprotei archaeon]